jgi:hypothetical protein
MRVQIPSAHLNQTRCLPLARRTQYHNLWAEVSRLSHQGPPAPTTRWNENPSSGRKSVFPVRNPRPQDTQSGPFGPEHVGYQR